MQDLHPMHLSSRQITGPSSVLSMALVRQAEAQAGLLQWLQADRMYCSPLEVSNAFTTSRCEVLVFRSTPASGKSSGDGNP
jgi:hypothetical protein